MQRPPFLGYNKDVIYVVFSEEPELARRSAIKILKQEFPVRDELNYVAFNMAVSSLKELVDECSFLPFGVERKAIFAEDCSFLLKQSKGKNAPKPSAKSKKKNLDVHLAALADYCKNPNTNIDLFLVAYGPNIDEGNPVVANIRSSGGKLFYPPLPQPKQLCDFAIRFLKKHGSDLDSDAAEELVRRVDGDYGRFQNELAKLTIYANGEPLSISAVKKLVAPKAEDDAFVMSNALLKNDIATAMQVYHDLKIHSVDEVRLINLLVNQFRFTDEVDFLLRSGYSTDRIASLLQAKPFRVTVTSRALSSCKKGAIASILEQLYFTEKSILTGEQAPRFAFERFLANFSMK